MHLLRKKVSPEARSSEISFAPEHGISDGFRAKSSGKSVIAERACAKPTWQCAVQLNQLILCHRQAHILWKIPQTYLFIFSFRFDFELIQLEKYQKMRINTWARYWTIVGFDLVRRSLQTRKWWLAKDDRHEWTPFCYGTLKGRSSRIYFEVTEICWNIVWILPTSLIYREWYLNLIDNGFF